MRTKRYNNSIRIRLKDLEYIQSIVDKTDPHFDSCAKVLEVIINTYRYGRKK